MEVEQGLTYFTRKRREAGEVVFRGSRDGLMIVLDDTESIELVLERLRERLDEVPGFFRGAEVTVDVGTRDISTEDFLRMESILTEEFGVKLLGIIDDSAGQRAGGTMPFEGGIFQVSEGNHRSGGEINIIDRHRKARGTHRGAGTRDEEMDGIQTKGRTILRSFGSRTRGASEPSSVEDGSSRASQTPDLFPSEGDAGEVEEGLMAKKVSDMSRKKELGFPKIEEIRRTLLLKKTLRSGQSVRYNGNVVILGNVNPGAEIVATGDIIVAGSLRGVAHAGASGDDSAVIAAFSLMPTQLRIAAHVARPPDGNEEYKGGTARLPRNGSSDKRFDYDRDLSG